MGFGVRLEVWGEFAAFNRPEMKVERVSYDVMTPSAARGILEAIHWKPEMRWVVDRIHVLAPIRFTQVRRNEISDRIPGKHTGVRAAMKSGHGRLGIAVENHRQQRASMILRDVRYGIEAHIIAHRATERDSGNPAAKHLEMFKRRASRGQCFHHPYLGCREFPASFAPRESFQSCPPELAGTCELGYMLHDIVFVRDPNGKVIDGNTGQRLTAQPRFFRATLNDGVLDVPPFETASA